MDADLMKMMNDILFSIAYVNFLAAGRITCKRKGSGTVYITPLLSFSPCGYGESHREDETLCHKPESAFQVVPVVYAVYVCMA